MSGAFFKADVHTPPAAGANVVHRMCRIIDAWCNHAMALPPVEQRRDVSFESFPLASPIVRFYALLTDVFEDGDVRRPRWGACDFVLDPTGRGNHWLDFNLHPTVPGSLPLIRSWLEEVVLPENHKDMVVQAGYWAPHVEQALLSTWASTGRQGALKRRYGKCSTSSSCDDSSSSTTIADIETKSSDDDNPAKRACGERHDHGKCFNKTGDDDDSSC